MNEQEIIHTAIQNLAAEKIKAQWRENTIEQLIDGQLIIFLAHHPPLHLYADVKKELRNQYIPEIERLAHNFQTFIILAEKIFPKVKEELQSKNINYLEANGNMFLNTNGVYINIQGKKYLETIKPATNRAFTKTGLQIIYQFLVNDNWVNRTYRDIAKLTGTGIGNLSNIFNGLKEEGYLLEISKNHYVLKNKNELLQKWILEYEKRLKPQLAIGRFRFLNEEDFYNWKNINLKSLKTFWGGEPAGALYTNFLRPEELTIYTSEDYNEIIKRYRLIPDPNGNVVVFKKFWANNEINNNLVHPILAYADLISKEDRRCTETAQKIHEEYLQNKF